MINLEGFLNFLAENIYLLVIFIVLSLIIHFWGLFYIRKHRKEDFSYSGHSFVWYEGSEFILSLAYIAWILGLLVAIFAMEALFYLLRL
jgi:hypothetical protein